MVFTLSIYVNLWKHILMTASLSCGISI